MTTPMTNDQTECLARVDGWLEHSLRRDTLAVDVLELSEYTSEETKALRALRTVIEKCAPNGYTTWDTSMVPMVDGKFDPTETEKWEKAHGHDIRLKCFPEFGCQLLIDPEDLLTDIKKELFR